VVAPARAPTSLKRPRNVSLRTCLRGEIEGMLPLDSNAGPAVRSDPRRRRPPAPGASPPGCGPPAGAL